MDIAAGDGWERLCPFLDRHVPDEPFPSSRSESRTASRDRAAVALRHGSTGVLHIGTHKTGTTSLQHFLHNEVGELLASVDAVYPPGFAVPTAHAELPLLAVRPELMWPARLRLPEVQDPDWLAAARRHVRGHLEASTRAHGRVFTRGPQLRAIGR